MSYTKFLTLLLLPFITIACSNSYMKDNDEISDSSIVPLSCVKKAEYKVELYDGYTYKTGGYCNDWLGQVINHSDFTIRCTNTINSTRAKTIFAGPNEISKLESIGVMSGRLSYRCMKWERKAQVWKDFPKSFYQLLLKMDSGEQFLTVKNLSSQNRRCAIKDHSGKVLIENLIGSGETLDWIKAPIGNFYTNCSHL